jgi:hypothetical protein
MTKKHKQMCGCEICIIMRQQQMSLNAYRLALLKRTEKEALEFEDNERRQIATIRAKQYRNAMYPNGAHLHSQSQRMLLFQLCVQTLMDLTFHICLAF